MKTAVSKTGKKQMKKQELALCLFLGFGTALIIKACCGNAGSDQLLWILAPTAWWARILGGLAFTYEPGVGYVNHAVQFIIAPSCAGVRFLTISLMMLTGSFMFRMGSLKQGLTWFAQSLGVAWLYTCLVNGIRMVLSIKLPPVLEAAGMGGTWLTWERLHTIIGTGVYFTALLLLYRLGERLAEKTMQRKQTGETIQAVARAGEGLQETGWRHSRLQPGSGKPGLWKPVLWYILPVLAIPLLNRIFRQDYKGFAEYFQLVGGACLVQFFILYLVHNSCRIWRRGKESNKRDAS